MAKKNEIWGVTVVEVTRIKMVVSWLSKKTINVFVV